MARHQPTRETAHDVFLKAWEKRSNTTLLTYLLIITLITIDQISRLLIMHTNDLTWEIRASLTLGAP